MLECSCSPLVQDKKKKTEDSRAPFQRQIDKIITSSWFCKHLLGTVNDHNDECKQVSTYQEMAIPSWCLRRCHDSGDPIWFGCSPCYFVLDEPRYKGTSSLLFHQSSPLWTSRHTRSVPGMTAFSGMTSLSEMATLSATVPTLHWMFALQGLDGTCLRTSLCPFWHFNQRLPNDACQGHSPDPQNVGFGTR